MNDSRKTAYIIFGWSQKYNYLHEIAKLLIEYCGFDAVGGLVNSIEYYEFLQNQDEIDYEILHCVPYVHKEIIQNSSKEERLSKIERKYGQPNIQSFLLADRDYIEFNHEDQKNLLQNGFNFFLSEFDKFDPDLCLSYSIAGFHVWVPFHLTHQRGGVSICLKPTRLPDRFALSINSAMDEFPEVYRRFDQFKSGKKSTDSLSKAKSQAESYLNTFRSESGAGRYIQLPDAEIGLSAFLSSLSLPFKAVRHFMRHSIVTDHPDTNDYRNESTVELSIDRALAAYRRTRMSITSHFNEADLSDRFVFFPLHVQPESTTMVQGQMYIDQATLAKQIARSLPAEYKLYVKDHPNMRGKRPFSYYDQFAELSNVRVVSPMLNSHDLIQHSDMVTTISGTAGFEALFYQTPALVCGQAHYKYMDMIFDGGDPNKFADQLYQGIYEYEHNEVELKQYLTALYAESFELPGGLFPPFTEETDRERARNVYDAIESYIN